MWILVVFKPEFDIKMSVNYVKKEHRAIPLRLVI